MTTSNGFNWFEKSGSWFEQWLHVKNGHELIVVRDKSEKTWICQYVESVTDIHLLGWFVGDCKEALEFFSQKVPN